MPLPEGIVLKASLKRSNGRRDAVAGAAVAALKGLSGARLDSSFALTTLADSTERY